jgi:iron complex outermembrane receptor protein
MRKYNFLLALIILYTISVFDIYSQDENKAKDTTRSYKVPSVTVTTSKAVERRTPVPFAEITQEKIENIYTTKDLPTMLSELPSLIYYSESGNNIGYSNIMLRGFDQRRISVMINGIPQNDPEDHNMYWINLPDFAAVLDNIQVQRGAGLTSYGAAAIGGSINMTTRNFTKESGVNLYSGVGFQEFSADSKDNQQTMSKFAIEASSGLIDNKYAVYGRLTRVNSMGYRNQSWAYLNGYFLSAARFDDNISTQINVFGGSQDDGLVYNGLPKSFVDDPELRRENYSYWQYEGDGDTFWYGVPRRDRAVEHFQQPHYELLNDIDITDNLRLKSSIFFYSGEGYFDYSGAGWTSKENYGFTPEYGFENAEDPINPLIRAYVHNRHGGWLPRLIWDHGGGTLTVGLEGRIHRSEHWGKLEYAENFPANFDQDYKFYEYFGERDIFSGYIREQYQVTEDILLHLETQLVYHRYNINDETFAEQYTSYNSTDGVVSGNDDLFNINYVFLNPRIGANYNLNENMNTYISMAYTSREPRMANLYNASEGWIGAQPLFRVADTTGGNVVYDFSDPIVEPEKMFNVEMGYSYTDERYHFNANFYWMEYFDELVKSGQVDIFGAPIDGNAERTRHYGIELTGRAVLVNSSKYGKFDITGNFTYSQNPIIDFDFITNSGVAVSLDGNEIAGFPTTMGNLRASYENSGLFLSIAMQHVGEFRTDNFGDMLTEDQRIIDHLRGYYDAESDSYPYSEYYTDNVLEAYTIFNADVSYTFENILSMRRFKVHAQVFNLLNTFYAASGNGREFFPGGERNIFIGFEMGI